MEEKINCWKQASEGCSMETEILTKYEEVQNALAAVDDVLDMSRI